MTLREEIANWPLEMEEQVHGYTIHARVEGGASKYRLIYWSNTFDCYMLGEPPMHSMRTFHGTIAAPFPSLKAAQEAIKQFRTGREATADSLVMVKHSMKPEIFYPPYEHGENASD